MVTVPAFVWRGGFLSRALTIGVPVGLAVAAVGPTLPGRRFRRNEVPLAHLANGPLVPIAARTFAGAR